MKKAAAAQHSWLVGRPFLFVVVVLYLVLGCSAGSRSFPVEEIPGVQLSAVDEVLRQSNAAGGQLLSTWSSLEGGNFSITTIDPQSGAPGKQLYAGSQFIQFFAITPAIDAAGKRMFIPVLGGGGQADPFPAALVGFQFSGATATLVDHVALPMSYIVSVQYDPVTSRVYVIGLPLNSRSATSSVVTVGYVDLQAKTFTNFTVLNPGKVPAEGGIGGGSSVLLADKRLLVLATMTSNNQGYLSLINLDTGKVTDVLLSNNFVAAAMALNTETNQINALVMTLSMQTNMTFCHLDVSGQVTPVRTWASLEFVFVVGSLATLDSENSRMYTVMGDGEGPPVALVTIDATTGQRLNAAFFQQNQPQAIFWMPN